MKDWSGCGSMRCIKLMKKFDCVCLKKDLRIGDDVMISCSKKQMQDWDDNELNKKDV